jgi:ferredoxin-NADP reductase
MGMPPNGLFTMEKLKNKWMMTGGTPMTPVTMAMEKYDALQS